DPGWHVAGALHYYRHQLDPRLPAVVVGSLRGYALGLRHLFRHHRLLRRGDLYLHSHYAVYFDLRNAHPAARGGGESKMSHTALSPAIYGLMAEFDTSTELVDAARLRMRPVTARWTPTARFPSRKPAKRLASTRAACRWSCCSADCWAVFLGSRCSIGSTSSP